MASGGSLEGLTSAQQVVDKLKTMASNADKIAGYGGTFVDPRLTAVAQTDEEAATDGELRVLWHPPTKSFKIAVDGIRGVKAFKIDPTATPQGIQTEERESTFELAATDDTTGAWVWDYDRETAANASAIATIANSGNQSESDTVGSNLTKNQLATPGIDPPPSTIPLGEFGDDGLTVTFSNPNSAEVSEIYYSVNGSYWATVADGASVAVPPGGQVAAFAHAKEAVEDEYYNSYVRAGRYEGTTIQLESPTIGASPEQFHPFDSPDVTISAADNANNSAGHSKVVYQINNGEWVDYLEAIVLNVDDFDVDPTVYAKAVSSKSDPKWAEYYLESPAVSVVIPIVKVDLETPQIAVAPSELHPFDSDTVSVSLTESAGGVPEAQEISKLVYSFDGQTWVDYSEALSLGIDDHSDGVTVLAKSVPTARLTSVNESPQGPAVIEAEHVTLPEPEIILSNPALDALNNIAVAVNITMPAGIPSDKTAIRYSLDEGEAWNDYDGVFDLDLGDHIEGVNVIAKAVPTAHPLNITESGTPSTAIPVEDATLAAPSIIASHTVLNAVTRPSITVAIDNPNSAAVSVAQYAINGGDWTEYTEEIVIDEADYTSGLEIVAKAVATQYSSILYSSEEVSEIIYVRLSPPLFSMESGACCENLYDKSLLLSDPNGSANSTIVYTVDGGSEQVYVPVVDALDPLAGAINIPGNTTIVATCQAGDGGYVLDSFQISHVYTAESQTELDPPVISPEGGTFSEFALVTITPPASNPDAQVIFTLDGSDPAVDEEGNIVNGTIYTEALSLEYFESSNESLTLDWEDGQWNGGLGWLNQGANQTLTNIGGLGIDVAVNQLDDSALGAIISNFGDDVWLGADGGDDPNLGYSIAFSQSVQLDTFSTGGLSIVDDISMANRIDLYGDDGTQLALGSLYVTSSQFANVFFTDGGLETVATSEDNYSQTDYDFGGLTVQELQWLHYGYQAGELAPPIPPTPNPNDECQYVQSFSLIDADTGEGIPGYDPIPDGIKVNLAHLPTTNISVRANVNGESCGDGNNGHGNNIDGFDSSNQGNSSGVGGVEDSDPTVDDEMHNHPNYNGNGVVGSAPKSVRMVLNGSGRTENAAPYSLKGDSGGTSYTPWNPSAGSYTITATPYKKKNAKGNKGTPMTMTFEVINDPSQGDPLDSLEQVGHDMVAFLSDITFHLSDVTSLPANYTVKARAIPVGIACRTYSQIAEANFVLEADEPGESDLPTPNITPTEGRFFAYVDVTIEEGDGSPEGTRIYYTTDGSTPAGDEYGNPTSGTLYTGSFTLSHSGQPGSADITRFVRARSFAPEGAGLEYVPSNSASAEFDITAVERLNAPSISPEEGSYDGSVEVAITATSAPEGSSIYYTLDGSDPGAGDTPTGGILYTGPFVLQHDASTALTLSEIVTARAYPPSDEVARYDVSYLNDAVFVFSPKFTLTFDESWLGFEHGSLVGNAYDNFGGGVWIGAGRYEWGSGWENDRALIFDTSLTNTADSDLEASFTSGNAAGDGFDNVLIVAENMVDSNGDGIIDSADDNGGGGYAWFDFDSTNISNVGFDILDIDNGEHSSFGAYLYDDSGNTSFLSGSQLASSFGTDVEWGDHSANHIDPIQASDLGLTNISGLVFTLPQSGGFDNITFGIGN